MKPLTLEETRLKEEMKHDCFWDNIHYKNPEAEKAFNLICHLEDFEVQYWKLQQENKQLQEELKCTIGIVEHNRIISEKNKEIHQLKDNWNKLRKFIVKEYYMYLPLDAGTKSITILIDKMQELEQGSDSNE